MKKVKKLLIFLLFIISVPFVLVSFFDYLSTKDEADIIIFIVFILPAIFSTQYLFKNWRLSGGIAMESENKKHGIFWWFFIGWWLTPAKWLTSLSSHNKSTQQIISVSNTHTINYIKPPLKNSLYALQQLAIPGSKRGILSSEQIVNTCDGILTQSSSIIDDCKKIIYETENPDTFYSRYKILLEEYELMATYEPYVGIYGYQPSESITYYVSEKGRFERKLINRCYNKALIKADSLKTEKAKKNQFIKAYDALLKYEVEMDPDTKDYRDKKFWDKIV